MKKDELESKDEIKKRNDAMPQHSKKIEAKTNITRDQVNKPLPNVTQKHLPVVVQSSSKSKFLGSITIPVQNNQKIKNTKTTEMPKPEPERGSKSAPEPKAVPVPNATPRPEIVPVNKTITKTAPAPETVPKATTTPKTIPKAEPVPETISKAELKTVSEKPESGMKIIKEKLFSIFKRK